MPRKEEEQDAARAAHAQFYHGSGDHVTLLNVFEAWREANYSKDWCHDHFMNIRQLKLAKSIRSQLRDIVDRQSLHDKDAQQPHYQHNNEKPRQSTSPQRKSKKSDQSSSSSRTILEAFSQGYGIHLSKKHPHRSMFYHYLASTLSSSSSGQQGGGGGTNGSLLALHVSPLSALYLDEERSMTKHGRKVSRDLEWIVYHEVVYHVKAVMRYVSKVDLRWVQDTTMERAKIYDQGAVWLNGERTELPSSSRSDVSSSTRSHDGTANQDGSMKRPSDESTAQNGDAAEEKKRARLELVEAARKRALERRQTQS